MHPILIIFVALLGAMAACSSGSDRATGSEPQHETDIQITDDQGHGPDPGSYGPACMAYEGDEIEVTNGRFIWRRFTDQREIDEHGKLVDPFPDYPKTGRIALRTSRLDFLADDGLLTASFYPQIVADKHYLLSAEQNQQFVSAGIIAECALVHSATESNRSSK